MAIITNDDLTEALATANSYAFYKPTATGAEGAGTFFSYFPVAGIPGAGTAPSVGLNGQTVDNTFGGVIPYTNAGVGNQKYLAGFSATASLVGLTLLYDRLWQNSGYTVTTTTAQATTFSGMPSRDANGAALGAGIQLWIEVYTATTNGAAVTNMTASYTNQAGTSGRTATMSSFAATAQVGYMAPFNLQAGDTGVRSVQSLTLGTSLGAGAVGLVCLRRLAAIDHRVIHSGDTRNFYDLGATLYDGTALCLMHLLSSNVSPTVTGMVIACEN